MAAGAAEAAAAVVEVGSAGQFEELLRLRAKSLLVVHFWAPWAPQCAQMNDVMAELAKEHPQVSFVKLEAEAVPEVSEKYEISSVPTFLFFKNSQKIDRLDGAHAPELTKKVQRHASSGSFSPSGGEHPKEDLSLRLKKLTHAAPCMLFMKGTPQEPRCGFSKQMVEILNKHNIQFSSFDIFSDEEVRQGLKTYSNWPTYPQLYVSGELIGGLDIIKELEASKELDTICPKAPKLEERLKVLTNKASVMLFMKGNKQEAKCGFSRQILEILNSTGIEYETFDILEDEEVRQGLKAYSNWPTYPQLYVKGELVGGLDIVKVIGAEAGQDCGGTPNPRDGALCLKPGYRKFQKRMVLCLTAGWLDRPLSCKVWMAHVQVPFVQSWQGHFSLACVCVVQRSAETWAELYTEALLLSWLCPLQDFPHVLQWLCLPRTLYSGSSSQKD